MFAIYTLANFYKITSSYLINKIYRWLYVCLWYKMYVNLNGNILCFLSNVVMVKKEVNPAIQNNVCV
jgi:hypothetical protein